MRITKTVGYAINWLLSSGKSIAQIAEELKLTQDQVTSYVEKNKSSKKEELPIKQSSVKSSQDLMIRHTRDKKTNNVAIMTAEASSVNDEMRKKLSSKINHNIEHIFKPNKK